MLERRLGVGRKSNHLKVSLRAGGVNALLTISLLAWRRLGATISLCRIPRADLVRRKGEFGLLLIICRGLGDATLPPAGKLRYFSTL